MALLDELKLTTYEPGAFSNPVSNRRHKFAAKIDEQIKLAVDPDYQPKKLIWREDAHGNRTRVEMPKRIKPWWSQSPDGTVLLTLRYGSKALELAKGKNAVEVLSKEDVEGTLRKIKLAVLAGEFDALLEKHIVKKKPIEANKS
ncbi:DUF6641 family protein [uncultured Roseovarius sp.]|uniref:DUF6641 family protein n=1 Tax=uncultured Roseovarius sp. TaxID=293344 RepID=UPI0025D5A15E|nr:DUF6641 family protein [uncultured Roseovarius sp.]